MSTRERHSVERAFVNVIDYYFMNQKQIQSFNVSEKKKSLILNKSSIFLSVKLKQFDLKTLKQTAL